MNTYGIKVGGSQDIMNPAKIKIYLINTAFDVGGSAIVIGTGEMTNWPYGDVTRYVDLELVLIGENKITSEGTAAAVKIGEDNTGANATLTISEGSTGSLDIQLDEDRAEEMVAIGNTGAAGNRCISGTLTVNGGTITTNGNLGAFGTRGYYMNGNGIVVADDIYTQGNNWQIDSGIYYETEEEGQNALNVVGDVTIKSPIPEDYPLYIGEGNSLTLGEGDVLEADKVTISGGTLKAYEVSYTINTASGVTVFPETISTKYMGKNTPLDKFSSISPEDNATIKLPDLTFCNISSLFNPILLR